MLQTIQTIEPTTIKTQQQQETVRRLEGWGAWLRAVYDPRLSYPHRAAFAQERGQGVAGYDDMEAEQMELLLARMMNMPARVKQYRALVQCYYFLSTERDGAAKSGMPKTTYREQLAKGEEYILQMLFSEVDKSDQKPYKSP